MELIKIVKAVGSFFLAVLVIAVPFMCALSFALDWNGSIKFILVAITVVLIAIITGWVYVESER